MYDWSPKAKTPTEIFETLLKPDEDGRTCKMVPNCISHNVCFLVDVTHLKSKNDWKSDEMGAWKNNAVQHLQFVLQDNDVYLADEIQSKCEGEPYTMKWIITRISHHQTLKRLYLSSKVSLLCFIVISMHFLGGHIYQVFSLSTYRICSNKRRGAN